MTTGTFTAAVEFVDNSSFLPNSEQVVTITGTGTGVAPIMTILPPALSFGMQPIGITGATQPVTLTNTGSAAMNLSGIVITGNSSTNFGFVLKGANACPYPTGPLLAGASCTISVDFTPQASGPVSATLSISDNAAGSPQSVALSGSGNGGTYGISLSPSSLNFATQTVGARSTMQTVTLTNTGTFATALTFATLGANPGDFAETDNCSQGPLAGGQVCVITVTFDPTQTGSRSAVIQISDAAPKSPQIVALSGSAVQATATVSPSPIAFGNTLAGTASPPVTVTIANTGTAPAVLSVGIPSVNPPGNFTTVNNCTAGVPATGTCTLVVTFTPPAVPATGACGSTAGAKTATLTITDNAPTSPQIVALSGASIDYCLAPSGVATQTVTAGTPATFQLIADSVQNFAGTVALSCADAASLSTCTVQPATVSLTSGAQVPIVLSVATATNAAAPFGRTPDVRRIKPDWPPPSAWRWPRIALWLLALLLMIVASASAAKRQPARGMRLAQTGAIMVLLSIGLAACFGAGTGTVAPAGTPTGTYTMTVTGTFTGTGGSTTRSVEVTLIVQ
jgi:trimeric autotransporter adhesin